MNKVFKKYEDSIRKMVEDRTKETNGIVERIKKIDSDIEDAELRIASATTECNTDEFRKAKAEKDDLVMMREMFCSRLKQFEKHDNISNDESKKMLKEINAEQNAIVEAAQTKAVKLIEEAIKIVVAARKEVESGNDVIREWNNNIKNVSDVHSKLMKTNKLFDYFAKDILSYNYYTVTGKKQPDTQSKILWWTTR